MRIRLYALRLTVALLWAVLLACSGRISPNQPDENAGRFVVVASSPANNGVNVPGGVPTTISVAFNTAVDTSTLGFLMAPVPAVFDRVFTLSGDGKTVIVGAVLQANTAYTAIIYSAKDKNGTALSAPFQLSFTTGSAFPTGRVQGVANVRVNGQPASPKGTLVGLLRIDLPELFRRVIFGGQEPLEVLRQNLAALTVITEESGSYSIDNVPDGTYWPAAIKDVNGDASLNPAPLGEDVLGYYDNPSLPDTATAGPEDNVRIVQGQTVTNINIRF